MDEPITFLPAQSTLGSANLQEAPAVAGTPPWRLLAQAFDMAILYALYIPALLLSQQFWGISVLAAQVVWGLVIVGYYTLSVGASGTTLGMALLRMHVVSQGSLTPPSYWQALRRAIAWILLSLLFMIGWLSVLADRQQWRGANDRFANTRVVREPMTLRRTVVALGALLLAGAVAFLVIGRAASSTKSGMSTDWKSVALPGSEFSAEFPISPRQSEQTLGLGRDRVVANVLSAELPDGTSYAIFVAPTSTDANSVLLNAKSSVQQNSERLISLDDDPQSNAYAGFHFVTQMKGALVRGRFVAGPSYVIEALTAGGDARRDPRGEYFLQSIAPRSSSG